jgi:hypothetical protein
MKRLVRAQYISYPGSERMSIFSSLTACRTTTGNKRMTPSTSHEF